MMNPEKCTARQKLAEAKAKYHKLLTGAESVSIRDGNSIIEFTRNDRDRLNAYVDHLEFELWRQFENTEHPLVAILHWWLEMFCKITQYFSSPMEDKTMQVETTIGDNGQAEKIEITLESGKQFVITPADCDDLRDTGGIQVRRVGASLLTINRSHDCSEFG